MACHLFPLHRAGARFDTLAVWLFHAGKPNILVASRTDTLLTQRRDPIDDDHLHQRHVGVIVFYVVLRIVRSLLLTTTGACLCDAKQLLMLSRSVSNCHECRD